MTVYRFNKTVCGLTAVLVGLLTISIASAETKPDRTRTATPDASTQDSMSSQKLDLPESDILEITVGEAADRPFEFRESEELLTGNQPDVEAKPVMVPLPATAGAAVAMLSCYGWGALLRRYRKRHMPE